MMHLAMWLHPHMVIGGHGGGGDLDFPGGLAGLLAVIFGSVILFVGLLLIFIFRMIGRVQAATRAYIEQLVAQGVVARSGRGWLTMVLTNYSGPGRRIGVGYYKAPGELLLTDQGLYVVGLALRRSAPYMIEFDLAHLAKCRVWVEGNELHVMTSEPPTGTGNVEIRYAFEGASAMCEQLIAKGAKP